MEVSIYFPFKPVSFQSYRIGKGKMFKPAKLIYYERDVLNALLRYEDKLKQFFEMFDQAELCLKTTWHFQYKNFYPSKGEKRISAQTLDVDNSVKNTQDIIFKLMVDKYGLDINDKDICCSSVFKGPGKKDGIYLTINMLKLEEIDILFKDLSESVFT